MFAFENGEVAFEKGVFALETETITLDKACGCIGKGACIGKVAYFTSCATFPLQSSDYLGSNSR